MPTFRDEKIIFNAICPQPIDPSECRVSLPRSREVGGYVCFEGLVRSFNNGKKVIRLDYEVYEPLALKEMRRICERATEEFELFSARCWHRSGSLNLGDTAVLIDVLARHRAEAFKGCRFIIDAIKHRVPIWKKEYYDDGTASWTQCHEHHDEPAF